MRTDKFILSGGQSHSLEMAMNREENGEWTPELVHKMTQGDNLGRFREYLLGRCELKRITLTVNFDGTTNGLGHPFHPIPDEGQIQSRIQGKWDFDPTRIGIMQTPSQGRNVAGVVIRTELQGVRVFGEQLLDFYLSNPHLVPADWKGKQVVFWGKIYRGPNSNLYVRSLRCEDRIEKDVASLGYTWGPGSGLPRVAAYMIG